MAKNDNKNNTKQVSLKLITFWVSIFAITVIFAVLFAIRFSEFRTFDSYEDIQGSKYSVMVDLNTKKDHEYYVYIYSAQIENGKYTDCKPADIDKAQDLHDPIFNYFNYYRRNHRSNDELLPIYGYNIKGNTKDSILNTYSIDATKLPMLVIMHDGGISDRYTDVSRIVSTLEGIMTKK